jgi:hypothetical protein
MLLPLLLAAVLAAATSNVLDDIACEGQIVAAKAKLNDDSFVNSLIQCLLR